MGHKPCGGFAFPALRVVHLGGFMCINAVRADNSRRQRAKAFTYFWCCLSQRAFRPVIECGYDALSWACGLVAAAWVTRDLAAEPGAFTMVWVFLASFL